MRFCVRRCTRAECGLRFPLDVESDLGRSCPFCDAETEMVDGAFNTHPVDDAGTPTGPQVGALLDNVRSLSNVGTVFRTADGVGASALHLCGFTPTPEHPKLGKTALGSERAVAWAHDPDALRRAKWLVERGHRLWAVEGGPRSEDLYAVDAGGPDSAPLTLVLGHEVSGVDPRVLECCERVLRIPMCGVKGSLNVAVAFAVAAYHVRFATRPR